MIGVAEAFAKFKSRLELNDGEQRDASHRQNDIRGFLREQFDSKADFLTGSYARWTKTKPLKDVDIFFVLSGDDAEYRRKEPGVILGKFRSVLAPRYGEVETTLGRRSVQIDFGVKQAEGEGDGHVMSFDVVPAVDVGQHYEIPDRVAGKWVSTDPEVHAELATSANKAFSQEWKPLVKMIKKWNQHKDKPVKPSFLLEVMALDLLVPAFSGGYAYELKSFFATAAERIREPWGDPAQLGPPVSDQMDSAAVAKAVDAFWEAEGMAGRAIRLAKDGRDGDALQEWRTLFGPLFPLS